MKKLLLVLFAYTVVLPILLAVVLCFVFQEAAFFLRRRFRCLLRGDWREAFRFPTRLRRSSAC